MKKISIGSIERYLLDPESLDEETQDSIRKALDEGAFASEVARFYREFHDILKAQGAFSENGQVSSSEKKRASRDPQGE